MVQRRGKEVRPLEPAMETDWAAVEALNDRLRKWSEGSEGAPLWLNPMPVLPFPRDLKFMAKIVVTSEKDAMALKGIYIRAAMTAYGFDFPEIEVITTIQHDAPRCVALSTCLNRGTKGEMYAFAQVLSDEIAILNGYPARLVDMLEGELQAALDAAGKQS